MISRLHQKQSALSLIEMLISLAIFAVVVVPMMELPAKMSQQSQDLQNTNSVNTENQYFFGQFQDDVNHALYFLPMNDIANASPTLYNTHRQVFMAYWDESTHSVKRVGYMWKEITDGGTSYFPSRWAFMRADIAAGETLADYTITGTKWKRMGQVLNENDFYIIGEGGGSSSPEFSYCDETNSCSLTDPKGVNGVRIQSTYPNKGIQITYRNSVTSVRPLYFRLGSQNSIASRASAPEQLLPFSMTVKDWSSGSTPYSYFWVGDKQITITVDGVSQDWRVPIAVSGDVPSVGTTILPITDLHYNYKSGDFIAVTNSTVVSATKGLYIFKFKKSEPDYPPFEMNYQKGSSYQDSFPVALHFGDPGYYCSTACTSVSANHDGEFIGVTQDLDDNIFVLMRATNEFWVEKFSPKGKFISRFNISRNTKNAANGAMGITYSPYTPNEVIILVKQDNDTHVLRAYPKDQSNDNEDRTIITANSIDLDNNSIDNNLLNWDNIKGLEFDMVHHRFIFVEGNGAANIQVLALDVDLRTAPPANENDGTPWQRAAMVQSIYNSTDATTLQYTPTGVAFDPNSNHLFISATNTTPSPAQQHLYEVIPNVRINWLYR